MIQFNAEIEKAVLGTILSGYRKSDGLMAYLDVDCFFYEANKKIFNVIDTRDRSNKPIIITTNLSIEDLMNPTSLAHARIYDRVLEMCPMRIVMQGESRRRTGATERRNKAKKILGI